jgi:branched-chain amino acid transport system permease protein
MVYGIIGLINFAHGDVFMLGAFLSGSVLFKLAAEGLLPATDSYFAVAVVILGLLVLAGSMCAGDQLVDRSLGL